MNRPIETPMINNRVTRVSVVTETFFPEINGVANTLRFLVEGLKAQGIVLQIIRPRQTRHDAESSSLDELHVTVPGLPIPGYKQLKFGLPYRRKIAAAFADFQPDAVYIATEGPLGLSALRAARKIQVPVLSGFHTNFHQYFEHYHLAWLKGLVFRYLRAFHNATARTLVPTRFLADDLAQKGIQNIEIMARGVDAKLFSPEKRSQVLRGEWGASSADPVLIYVGRIANEKNIQLALKSFELFKRIQSRAKMVLVGDGPLRKTLELAHPDVLFVGEKKGESLASYYASADLFLFPSLTDTYGNVVLEAMASGLHVISFDYAAAGSLIQSGKSGSLARWQDEADYLAIIKQLALEWQADEVLTIEARRIAETLSWQAISEFFLGQLNAIKEDKSNGADKTTVLIPKV